MNTKVILSFDTEDFTSSRAADGILNSVRILEHNGVRGCFAIVGYLARQLLAWKRFDVIEALQRHEIDFHTLGHSMHPSICEYTDKEDYQKVLEEMLIQESMGLGMIKSVFDVDTLYASVPPGVSQSYVAMYGYRKLGLRIYADSACTTEDCTPVFCAGQLHLSYYLSLEALYEELKDKIDYDAILDMIAKRRYAVLYHHPNKGIFKDFWDALNYNKENLCEYGKWKISEEQPQVWQDGFYHFFDELLRRIKADDRFSFTTYQEVAESASTEVQITKDMLPQMRDHIIKQIEPMQDPAISLSEMFAAACAFAKGETSCTPRDTYGFLSKPIGITESVTVDAADVLRAARAIDCTTFLPTEIKVGTALLGPADFLCALLRALCGEKRILLSARSQLNSIDAFPRLKDLCLKGAWLFSDTLEDRYLSERFRLQCWTIKYPAKL